VATRGRADCERHERCAHFSSATPAQAGDYQAIISSGSSRATSVVARLTVLPLTISRQPAPQDVPATSDAAFTVELSVGRRLISNGTSRTTHPRRDESNPDLPALPRTPERIASWPRIQYGSVTSSPAVLEVRAEPPQVAGATADYIAYAGENVFAANADRGRAAAFISLVAQSAPDSRRDECLTHTSEDFAPSKKAITWSWRKNLLGPSRNTFV